MPDCRPRTGVCARAGIGALVCFDARRASARTGGREAVWRLAGRAPRRAGAVSVLPATAAPCKTGRCGDEWCQCSQTPIPVIVVRKKPRRAIHRTEIRPNLNRFKLHPPSIPYYANRQTKALRKTNQIQHEPRCRNSKGRRRTAKRRQVRPAWRDPAVYRVAMEDSFISSGSWTCAVQCSAFR